MKDRIIERKSASIRIAKLAFRLVIIILVIWGIWKTVGNALRDLQAQRARLNQQLADLDRQVAQLEKDPAASQAAKDELKARRDRLQQQQFSLWKVKPAWLLLAGILYLAGMAPCWLFWYQTLRAMGQQPTLAEALRAFYIGHLGKYVPGKALVVVLRTGLIRSPRVDTTIAATSVFVETLTMMAVGATVAAAILALRSEQAWLLGLALGLMACAGIPTLPPIFRRIVRWLQVKRANPEIDQALEGLNFRLMVTGWLAIAPGWVLLGMSLWATMWAIGGVHVDLGQSLSDLPLLTACVALAMVAGFLSLIPGGLGVRELVVTALLAHQAPYNEIIALASAVLLRIVWLLSELVLSVILYVLPTKNTQAEPQG